MSRHDFFPKIQDLIPLFKEINLLDVLPETRSKVKTVNKANSRNKVHIQRIIVDRFAN
jgi:hypothetical protein